MENDIQQQSKNEELSQVFSLFMNRPSLTSWIISLMIAVISAVIVVNTFYYHTNITLDEHGKSIEQIKIDMLNIQDNMNNVAVYQSANSVEIKVMKEKMERLDFKIDKMNDKLDEILIRTNR